MDIATKADFLQNNFIQLLSSLTADTRGIWGKMNAQQMVEHFSDAFRIASGTMSNINLLTPEDHIEKMQSFLRSSKPFRENTKSALLPDEPNPPKHKHMEDAIAELIFESDIFFNRFKGDKNLQTLNPFFGWLNYDDNILLLYKHALHHLVQFRLWLYKEGQI